MLRRLLPTLLVLVLGFLALAGGLVSLQRIFARERDDALAAERSRLAALRQYGAEALRRQLHARLQEVGNRIDAAGDDPLVPSADVLFVRGDGTQVLPRRFEPLPGLGSPARALHEAVSRRVVADVGDGDSPWQERLRRIRAFQRALDAKDRESIEASFRSLLSHRARFVVAAAKEIPAAVATLEAFHERSAPDAALMRALLRDGLGDGRGGKIEGLQRALLLKRDRFTEADFAFLAGRVALLSEASGVSSDDFTERASETSGPSLPPAVGQADSTGALLEDRWYVERQADGTARGVAVSVDGLLAELSGEMRSRGLFTAEDRLALAGPVVRGLRAPGADVVSPSSPRREAAIGRNYRIKTGLGVLTGVLALALAAVGVLLQERKHRFLELKSHFVATVSHELRTPLASIRLLAETLERRLQDVPVARDYPSRIVREIDGLTFLVENILSWSPLEKGRRTLRAEPVSLQELVSPLFDEAEDGVVLTTQDLSDVKLLADPELLKLLFRNLFRNARKYASRSPVTIEVSARREDGVRVLFRDNGDGIPEAETEKVFEEFYRLPASAGRVPGGSGLGLAICRKVMELHGGAIRVLRSSPDGTTFELTFPA